MSLSLYDKMCKTTRYLEYIKSKTKNELNKCFYAHKDEIKWLSPCINTTNTIYDNLLLEDKLANYTLSEINDALEKARVNYNNLVKETTPSEKLCIIDNHELHTGTPFLFVMSTPSITANGIYTIKLPD